MYQLYHCVPLYSSDGRVGCHESRELGFNLHYYCWKFGQGPSGIRLPQFT